MGELFSVESLVAFLTLAGLEIVLGIDNVVFIAILSGKLPEDREASARRTGLLLAMGMRIAMLFAISWLMTLEAALFEVLGQEISGRDLILLGGGLFLIGKATYEIHDKLEGPEEGGTRKAAASFGAVLAQIVVIDMVFSLDSVITAVGWVSGEMTRWVGLTIMIAAIVVAIGVMLIFAGAIARFVHKHPTLKMLALAFLVLIGVMLVAEGMGQEIERGYIYFAMGLSLVVELLNMRIRKAAEPVELRRDKMPAEN